MVSEDEPACKRPRLHETAALSPVNENEKASDYGTAHKALLEEAAVPASNVDVGTLLTAMQQLMAMYKVWWSGLIPDCAQLSPELTGATSGDCVRPSADASGYVQVEYWTLLEELRAKRHMCMAGMEPALQDAVATAPEQQAASAAATGSNKTMRELMKVAAQPSDTAADDDVQLVAEHMVRLFKARACPRRPADWGLRNSSCAVLDWLSQGIGDSVEMCTRITVCCMSLQAPREDNTADHEGDDAGVVQRDGCAAAAIVMPAKIHLLCVKVWCSC